MLRTYKLHSGLFSPATVTLQQDRPEAGTLSSAPPPRKGRGRSASQAVGGRSLYPSPELHPVDNSPRTESGIGYHAGDENSALLVRSSFSVQSSSPRSLADNNGLHGPAEPNHWRKSSVTLAHGQRVFLHNPTNGQVLWETDVPLSMAATGPHKLPLRQPKQHKLPHHQQLATQSPVQLCMRAEFCLVSASFHLDGRKFRWVLLSNALGVGDGSFVCMDTVAKDPIARLERSSLRLFRNSSRLVIHENLPPAHDALLAFTLLVALEFCRTHGISL
ncbi:hypothetical protein H4R34_002211 [Dimargaris verticillata]|uniref:Uncharacterized protein n=1 Tax=Dimargaris verticillata TaxID=2761393 RepID=A0A9W8B8I8_9FUNG|nr:hypothetical protein H4R34_002211 [Dimargaris verticillata]